MKKSAFILSLAAVLLTSFSVCPQQVSAKSHGKDDSEQKDHKEKEKPANVARPSAPNVARQNPHNNANGGNRANSAQSPHKQRIDRTGSNPQNSGVAHQSRGENVRNEVPSHAQNSRTDRQRQFQSRNAQNNGHMNSRPLNRMAVSPQLKKFGVHSYPKPIEKEHLLVEKRERSTIAYPKAGPGGKALKASAISRTNFSSNPSVRTHMNLVTTNSFKMQINNYNRAETVRGSYYWHSGNGYNYCHYYDPWGYHWYGWYVGSSYFWTRYYGDNWWWYDPTYYRWCYWHDGGWWWQDPNRTTVVYVYRDGNYDEVGDESDVSYDSPKRVFKSGDGTREIRVVGSDAFLYDTSGDNLFKPIYLDSDVTSVKFSNTSNGKPLQVLLVLKDGSFETFDDQGNPISGN